jgi:hypothetical protein
VAVTRETLRLARRLRIDLSAIVDQRTRELVKAWARAFDEISSSWDAVVTDLLSVGEGSWPSQAQILRASRAQQALAATAEQLRDLARLTGVTVSGDLAGIVAEAAAMQPRLIVSQLPVDKADVASMVARFDRVDPRALDMIVQRTTQQITAATLPISVEAGEAMRRVLIRGVAEGLNPRAAARLMLRRLEGAFMGNFGATRALRVARTEMLDAHRLAAAQAQLVNHQTLAGWQWLAQLDRRTCPSCWSQHGSMHSLIEAGPLDHQQGRCARLCVTKSWRQLGFQLDEPPPLVPDARQVFDALPEKDQIRVMGAQRLELLRSGRARWEDLSQRRSTPDWRDSFGPTPVARLAAAA